MTSDPPIAGRLRFDPVLSWGHILVALTVMLSGITLYASNEVRYADLNLRVRTVETMIADNRVSTQKMTDRLTDILVEISAIKATLPNTPKNTFPSR